MAEKCSNFCHAQFLLLESIYHAMILFTKHVYTIYIYIYIYIYDLFRSKQRNWILSSSYTVCYGINPTYEKCLWKFIHHFVFTLLCGFPFQSTNRWKIMKHIFDISWSSPHNSHNSYYDGGLCSLQSIYVHPCLIVCSVQYIKQMDYQRVRDDLDTF